MPEMREHYTSCIGGYKFGPWMGGDNKNSDIERSVGKEKVKGARVVRLGSFCVRDTGTHLEKGESDTCLLRKKERSYGDEKKRKAERRIVRGYGLIDKWGEPGNRI